MGLLYGKNCYLLQVDYLSDIYSSSIFFDHLGPTQV